MAITLIGFMGAGKTTIGSSLAERLSLPFIDLDHYIEEHQSRKIPDIFKTKGEVFFRRLEEAALKQLINEKIVLATGGGIIENTNNIKILKENNLNIWVDTNFDEMYNRIVGDLNRPNAASRSLSELLDLYNKRRSRYNEIAYMKVNSGMTVDDCVDQIIHFLRV